MAVFTDPFIDVIATELSNISTTNSLGWNVVKQNSPSRREWNVVPLVIVTPSPKTNVKYLGFGKVTRVFNYDCYLLVTGDLASNFNNTATNFYEQIEATFMP